MHKLSHYYNTCHLVIGNVLLKQKLYSYTDKETERFKP